MNTIYVVPNALNGAMVLAIRETNPTARIVCLEVFPFYVEHLSTELKVEVALLDTSKDLVLQLKTIGTQMKIDWNNVTVLMNAPYQEVDNDSGDRKDQASNLWGDFIYAFAELSPRVASVQPSSWLSPSVDFKGKRYNRFGTEWRNHLRKINVKECARHFPGVGSHFTYFVLDKKNQYPLTTIITESGPVDYAFSANPVLGYTGLTPQRILNISNFVYTEWMNDFGFSRQGYDCLDDKIYYKNSGTYPIFHTNRQKDPSNKKKTEKSSSFMKTVVKVETHANVKANFTFSDVPHPHQFTPKVIVCLDGKYKPVLDENGELGYTNHSLVVLCNDSKEARSVYELLSDPLLVDTMESMKWNGFVNIEMLMRLKCKNEVLRESRKNSIHAQKKTDKMSKKFTVQNKNIEEIFCNDFK